MVEFVCVQLCLRYWCWSFGFVGWVFVGYWLLAFCWCLFAVIGWVGFVDCYLYCLDILLVIRFWFGYSCDCLLI